MKKRTVFAMMGIFALFALLVTATDLIPQGNINLKSVYSIINAVDVNATNIHVTTITPTTVVSTSILMNTTTGATCPEITIDSNGCIVFDTCGGNITHCR